MSKILIVVDMQNGFMIGENFLLVKDKVNNLLKTRNYEQVIYTKYINNEGSIFQNKLHWYGMQNEKERQICVDIVPNSVIFTKETYGLTTKQIDYIKNMNIEEIDICGVETDACVMAIAFQMFDNGIIPNVLLNYCTTTDYKNNHLDRLFKSQFGKVEIE